MTEEKNEKKSSSGSDSEVKVPKKFEEIVKRIEEMTVIDLAELVKVLEKKFGVTTSAPVMAVSTATSGALSVSSAAPAEKSVFNIELKEVGEKKIEVIKVVRDVTGKGLKESKDLVDAVTSGPQIIKENSKKEEAEEIKKKFEAVGAKVELK